MKHLEDGSKVVYLKVSLDDLKSRLTDMKERGVAIRLDESIEKMYEHRSVLYEKYADITIEEDRSSIEKTVLAVMNQVGCSK